VPAHGPGRGQQDQRRSHDDRARNEEKAALALALPVVGNHSDDRLSKDVAWRCGGPDEMYRVPKTG